MVYWYFVEIDYSEFVYGFFVLKWLSFLLGIYFLLRSSKMLL